MARLVKQTPTELVHEPDRIVVAWPWKLEFIIEQRLAGQEARERISATMVLHVGYRREVKHALVFLKRHPTRGYRVLELKSPVVFDNTNRFVMPMAKPYRFNDESVDEFIPKDYERLLRPVRYRPKDAWFLSEDHLERLPTCERNSFSGEVECRRTYSGDHSRPLDTSAYPWGAFKDGYMVADRGLFMADLIKAVADRKCPQ